MPCCEPQLPRTTCLSFIPPLCTHLQTLSSPSRPLEHQNTVCNSLSSQSGVISKWCMSACQGCNHCLAQLLFRGQWRPMQAHILLCCQAGAPRHQPPAARCGIRDRGRQLPPLLPERVERSLELEPVPLPPLVPGRGFALPDPLPLAVRGAWGGEALWVEGERRGWMWVGGETVCVCVCGERRPY